MRISKWNAAAFFSIVLTTGVAFGEEGFDRTVLEKWIKTRQMISMEKNEWRVARQMLQDRVKLMGREIEIYSNKTTKARNDVGEADEQLEKMTNRNKELKSATAGLSDTAVSLEKRIRDLLARSPPPIKDKVVPLTSQMPPNPDDTDMALSERFQNVIGILNEMNKFAGVITEATEVRDLSDKSQAEVTVLYLGFGQAYYCNRKRGLAGIGLPAEKGWAWQQKNDIAGRVADTIAIYRNEKTASYVLLPVPPGSKGIVAETKSLRNLSAKETEK